MRAVSSSGDDLTRNSQPKHGTCLHFWRAPSFALVVRAQTRRVKKLLAADDRCILEHRGRDPEARSDGIL